MTRDERIKKLKEEWNNDPRWANVERPYSADQVADLIGPVQVEQTLAKMGADKLWNGINNEHYISGLGALTGNQAVQEVAAGLKSIYLSGWQVAADANLGESMYPDQSLYPANSVPSVVRRINSALHRAGQVQHVNGKDDVDYMVPIVADAEAGFGGLLNAYELMKGMIDAGAAAVHFEDQLASAKKCGHMGGKVLVPTREHINKLVAARLASDVMGAPTLIIARTDADAATLITSDVDERDRKFIKDEERTDEGFFKVKNGLEQAIDRGLSYAPYADLVWCETSNPDIGEAREFAQAIREKYPDQLLAYNCSPSFNWGAKMSEKEMLNFREELADMGYKYQFITLAGFHALNTSMFELSKAYKERGMAGYSELQQKEFELEEKEGFSAVKHQAFVGATYFDEIQNVVTGGKSSTGAMKGSTEEAQFA